MGYTASAQADKTAQFGYMEYPHQFDVKVNVETEQGTHSSYIRSCVILYIPFTTGKRLSMNEKKCWKNVWGKSVIAYPLE